MNSQETFHALKQYVIDGHLLHGSNLQLTVLKPQAPSSDSGGAIHTQNAVYATQDPRIACAMAMFTRKDKTNPDAQTFYHVTNDQCEIGGTNIMFGAGFVHILPRDTFVYLEDKTGDYDWVSYQTVKPVATLPVDASIADYFENTTFRFN